MDKSQAIAYATIAMNKLGYKQEEIEKVTNEMIMQIDSMKTEAAEIQANNIIYGD